MSHKVKGVVQIDDIDNLHLFDQENKATTWYFIPKGDRIRLVDGVAYFDSVSKSIQGIVTGKVIVIGFTSDITAVSLIPEKELWQFCDMIAPKKIIEVSTFKLKW